MQRDDASVDLEFVVDSQRGGVSQQVPGGLRLERTSGLTNGALGLVESDYWTGCCPSLRTASADEIGQLYSRSPFLFSRCYRDPKATDAAFHDGFATSGNLARVDDEGYIYVVGRRSDVIKSGGVGIYPREVEDVLMAHPVCAMRSWGSPTRDGENVSTPWLY
jgi:acyl-CoA synthetase (AMP-forming)/AMP-acid ligase II